MSFKERMEDASQKQKSSIILALDFPFHNPNDRKILQDKAENMLDIVAPYICAIKINHHLTLPLGLFNGVQKLIRKAQEAGLMTIMDCKVNDIGATNQVIAEYYFAAGFDALIANPFVGWKEGLESIFEVAQQRKRGVILLAYMSHRGSAEGYGQIIYDQEKHTEMRQYVSFARKALQWNAAGVVAGATVPEKIKEIHEILQERVPIYSPGIGTQGGAAETALRAGARYLIVGREIIQAENPTFAAEKLSTSAKRPTQS